MTRQEIILGQLKVVLAELNRLETTIKQDRDMLAGMCLHANQLLALDWLTASLQTLEDSRVNVYTAICTLSK